ncbi:uncharacterized protein LOC128801795 [Vidua chalybeata]|uniref:uncharacterized protein LOC128801795 n=1 Tax=Vidua chalybeata TaxID=81927 RepID=UPI0023A83C81|nr:uncharacterized protein LOC128801795 [Vidua chalybeata]
MKTPLVWESSCQQLQLQKGVSAASGACTAFAMSPGGFCSLKLGVCGSRAWNSLRLLVQPRTDPAQYFVLFSCCVKGLWLLQGRCESKMLSRGCLAPWHFPPQAVFSLTASGSCSLFPCRAPHVWIPSSSSFGNSVSLAEPAEKFLEVEQIGQGAFGTVSKELDRATGGEVGVNAPSTSGSSPGLSPLLGAVAAALGASRAFLHRLLL